MADPTDTPTDTPTETPPPTGPWWRTGRGIAAIVAAAAVLVILVVAIAVAGSDDDEAGKSTTTTEQAGGSGANGSGASGASGTSGSKGGKGGKGGKGTGASGATGSGGSTTTSVPPATIETTPDGEPDLAKVRVAITPGTCVWNADTLDLIAKGTIRNDNPIDAVVSVDVSFLDAAGGEVDTASDLQVLGPGEQANWDVLGASIDPPTGGLRCEVTLS